uniref:Lipocalin/cytosolic fatty-acid binding domain-containing protein n=1 Tax=Arion vulgaris TaxID=1028688 RepID=A0A0B6ZDM0_9EUPU
MERFYGNWKVQLDKTMGVAEIGKLMGWTQEIQTLFATLNYVLLIEASGNNTRCCIDYGVVKIEFFFTLGEVFDYKSAEGTKSKCTIILDDGKLVESYVTDEGAQWRTERVLNGTSMTATTMFAGHPNIKCVQTLLKV